MQTLTFKAPDDLTQKLEYFARQQERNKSFLIRKAVEGYLAELEEEEEDYRLAMRVLATDDPSRRISLEELERKYGLAD